VVLTFVNTESVLHGEEEEEADCPQNCYCPGVIATLAGGPSPRVQRSGQVLNQLFGHYEFRTDNIGYKTISLA
jgi:hypothetical protein